MVWFTSNSKASGAAWVLQIEVQVVIEVRWRRVGSEFSPPQGVGIVSFPANPKHRRRRRSGMASAAWASCWTAHCPSPLAQVWPCSFAVHQVQPLRVWISEVVFAFAGGAGSEGGGGDGGGGAGGGGGGGGGLEGCWTGGLEGCCVGVFCEPVELPELVCPPEFAEPTPESELAFAAGAPPQPVKQMSAPPSMANARSFG